MAPPVSDKTNPLMSQKSREEDERAFKIKTEYLKITLKGLQDMLETEKKKLKMERGEVEGLAREHGLVLLEPTSPTQKHNTSRLTDSQCLHQQPSQFPTQATPTVNPQITSFEYQKAQMDKWQAESEENRIPNSMMMKSPSEIIWTDACLQEAMDHRSAIQFDSFGNREQSLSWPVFRKKSGHIFNEGVTKRRAETYGRFDSGNKLSTLYAGSMGENYIKEDPQMKIIESKNANDNELKVNDICRDNLYNKTSPHLDMRSYQSRENNKDLTTFYLETLQGFYPEDAYITRKDLTNLNQNNFSTISHYDIGDLNEVYADPMSDVPNDSDSPLTSEEHLAVLMSEVDEITRAIDGLQNKL